MSCILFSNETPTSELRGICSSIGSDARTEHLELKGDLKESLISHGLEEALKRNRTLVSLSFNGDLVDDVDAGKIIGALKDNLVLTHLNFKGNMRIGKNSAENLGKALGQNKTIMGLSLENCNIGQQEVEKICNPFENIPNSYLNLSNNPITDQGIIYIYIQV